MMGRRHGSRGMVLLGWLLVAVLTGCAGVPTAGPVERVSPYARATPDDRGVQILPQEPQPNDSPELLVAGFLNAMASLQPDFSVARQYLTEAASKQWDPSAGVTIFDGDAQRLVATEESAVLSAPRIGRLDSRGRYATGQPMELQQDFGITRESGQWRISEPPEGLLISRSTFGNYFSRFQLFFADPAGDRVVPESIWLPDADLNPTTAVKDLLAGPSPWYGPAVITALPTDTQLAVDVVQTSKSGVAEVNLSSQVNALGTDQRRLMAAQIVWTLQQFGWIDAVQLQVEGQAFSVAGQGSDGRISVAEMMGFRTIADTPRAQPLVVTDQEVIRVAQDGTARGIGGDLGQRTSADIADVAFGGGTVAVLAADRKSLDVGELNGELQPCQATGTLTSPQVMTDGSVWVASTAARDNALLQCLPGEAPRRFPLNELPGQLSRFRISPDGTKVALVSTVNGEQVLGLMRVAEVSHRAIEGWRQLYLTAAISPRPALLSGLAWAGPDQLLILGASDSASRSAIYLMSDDGADISPVGPSGAANPVALSAQPRMGDVTAVAVTRSGQLLDFSQPWRWGAVLGGVRLAVLPG